MKKIDMKKIDKYMIMKIILLLNPIPFTVIFYGMFTLFLAQLKFISRSFSMSWWFKILPIIGGFVVFEILGTILPSIYLSSYQIIFYIVLKIIDLILGYFMVMKLEKSDLITFKKV